MVKSLKYYSLLSFAACLLLVMPANAQGEINGNLVSSSWLEKNLNNPDILIIDASPSQMYSVKHIPGAVNYDLFTYGPQQMPVAEIEKRFQSLGISPGKKLVLYDQGGTFLATSLLFNLYYYGFPEKDLLVLDGGLSLWEKNGLPVTKEKTPVPAKGTFTVGKLNENARVDLPEFLTASGDLSRNVLLEALDPDWHYGGNPFFSKAGHIPNAIMIPSDDFFNADKSFKSPEEIQKMLTYLGIRPEQQIHNHCGGGIAASVPFFALKFLVDYPNVKLFPGSQLEWVSDQRELPFWTYDAPYLLRESKWLQFWGGQRTRMYGISNVSIIDIRPTDEFKKGHIPFALNLPADLFKKNINNPDRLADSLGAAGVNAAHETIIVSGGGLTKEAALTYLLLESMGQEKISVLADPHQKWEEHGLNLTKDPTIIGDKKGPMDLSIPPTEYPKNFRNELIITDPKSTSGIYPKVFIASGGIVPGKALEGKVVHLPYSQLLNFDGKPKAAKEIWDLLTKAGVPRYAELVCYSDDPAEAAVNYFILKMMGFPDIKVMVI
jgi:thiosulfate/3-mercaptopyruvate sulfurtransferase